MLRAEHLVRQIEGEVPVSLVNDVSLQIAAGEMACITGPSGSGKSSLLYLLGLLDLPSRGSVWLNGVKTSDWSEQQLAEHRLKQLGFVFQFHFLLAEFSVLDNVRLPMRRLGLLSNAAMQQRALDLLTTLGLLPHAQQFPHQLSGGQRQRVAIARALANDPPIILADEPTGNLDSLAAAKVRDILQNLAHEMGKTIVVVSHDANIAALADHRIAIVDGKIEQDSKT